MKRRWWDIECKVSEKKINKCIKKVKKRGRGEQECNRRKREHECLITDKRQLKKSKYEEVVEKAIGGRMKF